MGRIFPDKVIAKGQEQGFNRFETIILLAKRAKQKSNAVQGVKYLTDAERKWSKAQHKFPVQAIKEFGSNEFDFNNYLKEITETIEEDNIITPKKEIENTKTKE